MFWYNLWVENKAGQVSVFHFCAASVFEAFLLCVLEATAGHMTIF
jgi:hypothetical protein